MKPSFPTSSRRTRSRAIAVAMALLTTVAWHARADQGPVTSQPDTALTDKARDLFNEGREQFSEAQLDRAHASFLAAWALKRHWQIAGMLGECELRLGNHRDAAEHISFALRFGANQATTAEIAAMRSSFKEARKHVGELQIQVDRMGAEVLVDGSLIARTPLTDPVFVDPGMHEVEARVEQREGVRAKVQVGAGGTQTVSLSFTRSGGPVVANGPAGDAQGATHDATTRPMWPVYVGAGVAVVGLGLGVGYTIAARGKDNDREDLLSSLGGPNPCAPGNPNGAACARVVALRDDADKDRAIALGGFIAGGVAAAGTITYLVWPRRGGSTASTLVLPVAGREGAGLALLSLF